MFQLNICVKARQNMIFGLSYEKNEAVLTACYYFVIIILHESLILWINQA